MKRFLCILVSMCLIIMPCVSFADDMNTGIQDGWVINGGNTYYYSNGEKLKGKQVIADKDGTDSTYYFGEESGIMQTEWVDIEGYRYYFSKDTGKMTVGWLTLSESKYYFNGKGHAVKGLQEIGNAKYYFSKTTYKMMKGFRTIGDYRYYFSKESGKMFKGWHKLGGYKYYFGKTSGHMFLGWHTLSDNKYYFGKSTGHMYTGLHKINGNVYTFSTEGVLKRTVYKNKPAVALTYDDGPSGNTKTILNTLKKYNALATFFVVGNRISSYQSSVEKAYSMGCQIGNHSWSHPWYGQLSSESIKTQIKKCNNKVKNITGSKPVICRTPGGDVQSFITKAVGMPIILWSIDTRDWEHQNKKKTYNAVMNYVKDGDIVLMHDLYSSTAEASKNIIPALYKKGYQMVTIEELAMLKGKTLKAGKVYYSIR